MTASESNLSKAVVRQIESAFKPVGTLQQPSLYFCYGLAVHGGGHGDNRQVNEERSNWRRVSDEYLLDYWHGLSYLNSASFAYYLPRLMVFFLNCDLNSHVEMLDRFLFVLLRMVGEETSSLTEILDASQVAAIVGFLLTIRDRTSEHSIQLKLRKILRSLESNQTG